MIHLIAAPRFPGDLVEHARAWNVLAEEVDAPGGPGAAAVRGAFERAARRLRLDPSVLRRRLQALEVFVGGALLGGRGADLRPTTLGARVRGDAERLLAAADALRSGAAPTPRVVVGCTEAIAAELMPDVLGALRRRHAGGSAAIALRRVGTEACVARVLAGEIDVGVVRGPVAAAERWPRPLRATYLGADRLWVVCARRSALAAARRVTLAALARSPLVLYGPASATRRRVMAALVPLGAPFGATAPLEIEGRATAVAYARRGFGISFLSLLPRHTPRAAGVVFRDVTRLFAPSGFWVIVRHTETSAPALALASLTLAQARVPRQLQLTPS